MAGSDGAAEFQTQTQEEHAGRIQVLHSQLLSSLTCVGDIAADMFQKGKLTDKELECIQHLHSTPIRAGEELLNILKCRPSNVYECFLSALTKTNQHHVSSMLTSESEIITPGHSRLIQQHYQWLCERISPDYGLTTILREYGVLTIREYENVRSKQDWLTKNEVLLFLSIIRRKSSADFAKFRQALIKSEQKHIADKLNSWTGKESTASQHLFLINHNLSWLIEHIDPTNGLVTLLYQKNVLNIREREEVNSKMGVYRMNEQLLLIIYQKSFENFELFKNALKETNQEHVFQKLCEIPDSVSESPLQGTTNPRRGESKVILLDDRSAIIKVVQLYDYYRRKNDTSTVKSEEFNEKACIENRIKDELTLKNLLQKETPAIYGMALLDDEVFIARLQQSCVEVYDSGTFQFKRRIYVIGMTNPEHIVSCSINICLYAFDWNYYGSTPEILRINPRHGSLIKHWKTHLGGGRLSVTRDSNIILNINWNAKLMEFTPDGKMVRVINLKSVTGIIRTWHSLKLRSGQFVICHGGYGDPQSRVCLLRVEKEPNADETFDAQLIKAFGGAEGSTLEDLAGPAYLATDNEESIAVSDFGNRRTLLLNASLENPALLMSDVKNGFGLPWRVCFDELRGRWLVADYNHVLALVFKNGVQLKAETYFPSG